jgi:hypothetical protein
VPAMVWVLASKIAAEIRVCFRSPEGLQNCRGAPGPRATSGNWRVGAQLEENTALRARRARRGSGYKRSALGEARDEKATGESGE